MNLMHVCIFKGTEGILKNFRVGLGQTVPGNKFTGQFLFLKMMQGDTSSKTLILGMI
jgi:hypothetical protein